MTTVEKSEWIVNSVAENSESGGDDMKSDYKNWMPRGMIYAFLGAAVAALALCLVIGCTGLLAAGTLKTILTVVFAILAVIFCGLTVWSVLMHRAFDYNGKRRMSAQIIEGTATWVKLPVGGKCLDVGCGSGALAIAVAKRNPQAQVIGIDRWGAEYASFSKTLCERNAKAEGVTNTTFRQGDATHLDFPDETFDAVVSNYVYHNIPGDRQQYLLETLRTLKKGGTFAIHDIFSKSKYGDMQAFVRKLRDMGYQRVELIDTTNGRFMTRFEAGWMALSGSALLTGIK
jgi:ubiquinone/menaquinone biosynthesis C-methylase UbiE